MPSRSANSRSDRARPEASSSNHARPRAIALISVGSHLDRSFCVATPGSTSLISVPRRRKATGAVSSIGLSLGFSDEGGTTAPPDSELRRILIVIAFSSITTFSMRSRTTLARSAGERLSTAARRLARSSIFRVWPLGMAVPKRSISSAGLDSASAKTLITASSISWAGSRQPWDWAVPGLGDQGSGDVVAIASALLDGVRRGEPLAPGIGQETRQQARLGCIGLASMVRRVGNELIPNGGPRLGIDQRRMLSGVELALVRNLTDVDGARQQMVDVS